MNDIRCPQKLVLGILQKINGAAKKHICAWSHKEISTMYSSIFAVLSLDYC